MRELIQVINDWAREKGIFQKATPLAQMEKTFEECHELQEALYHQLNGAHGYTNSKGKEVITDEEIQDAIGDICVTLIIQCEMQGLDIEDCIQSAYDVIKDRKGKMVDGKFIKEE